MTTKPKARSRIFEAVYETASDLHRLGFIDKRALRKNLHLNQTVLAAVLNTSVPTVRKWEVGDKEPSGPSSKPLRLIERKGLEAVC
ncbi:helix-turn-helix domain-containing protein [Acidiferrobacter thiooxydans]|uniref:Helix-turn-helix domain-containing protein n=1 Tax=Acidiferrobacter thiooxydans TaxID=163359 RepID=A0A1C2FZW1_9GAMM|nr:helix-turn-helix domain-containing protein [Acidiferrobacter thiooxydans]RCN57011.1 helix-turn-helix domain-containing protein [Acidiferrobacter thiooxydans]UEN99703.1 helix-turn-helix domain-containing protein [Acidiferrobacter thiooxydans]